MVLEKQTFFENKLFILPRQPIKFSNSEKSLIKCGELLNKHVCKNKILLSTMKRPAIPKALKMVPVATLLGAQYYKASTGFSSPNKYCTTNIATLTKINVRKKRRRKSLIIVNVCIHRRTVSLRVQSHIELRLPSRTTLFKAPSPSVSGD